MAIQAHLPGDLIDHALGTDLGVALLANQDGGLGIELLVALPADDQIAVTLFGEPGEVLLGGDPGIEHHRRGHGAGGQREVLQHLLQGLGLADVAREDLAALGKAAGVQHQGQGHQRAVGALLLGVAVLGLGVAAGRALEEGVGQVIQGNGLGEREQVPLLAVEMGLQGRAVGQELVAHPIQARQIQGAEVVVQQLPKATALLQPLVGRQLAARLHHAPDNRPDGGAQLVAIEPQLHQLAIQTQPPQRLQRHMLGPHTARADDLHP